MLELKKEKKEKLYDDKVTREYSVSLEKRSIDKKISILSDTMFKAMFFHENRMKYSCKFLSYYLNIDYDELLNTLKLGKNELDKRREIDKGEHADYVAYIGDTTINIEVNCNEALETLERNMEYAHRLYAKKIKRGSNYGYTQVIQFNLNNFAFQNNHKIIDTYYLQNNEGKLLHNGLIFVQIFIPNLRKKWYNEGVESLTEDERYLLTLVESSIEKSKVIGKGDLLMEEYIEDATKTSQDDYLGEAYDKEWALKDQGHREGLEEGMKQGIEQNKKEMITKMISKGFDLKIISEITDLSIEEIKQYQKGTV